jgi:tetratricopeptide (TPR) repeat protein/DNA-binding CsgD family transcriptional regulator
MVIQDHEVFFPENIYAEHLATINDVNFTPREIDVISCLLNARRTSQIASILSIAPRTVTTHFRNIMQKLGCSSQEVIISFIEKSHKLPIFREYYSRLLIQSAFESALNEISKLKRVENLSPVIVYWKDQNLKNVLIHKLEKHLTQAGVNAEICELNLAQKVEKIKGSNNFCVFLLNKNNQENSYIEFTDFSIIDLDKEKNYYNCFFNIIKNNFSSIILEKIIGEFFKKHEMFNNSFFEKRTPSLSLIPSIKACKSENTLRNVNASFPIRSELVVPPDSIFLSRDDLINQIDEKLEEPQDISTIALIGIGGAGKTTLSRYYARQQSANVIWEINAETQENLLYSFEKLAYALSPTEEERKLLRGLQEINNLKEREDRTFQFVKERLRVIQNWFLIYDNVERFADIQKCFPYDAVTWGRGKVLVTTRDSNIRNNSYINHVLSVGELSNDEGFSLFCSLIFSGKSAYFDNNKEKPVRSFLNSIPPFPLDISVAAYYLKTTGISYEKYLEHLRKKCEKFEVIQEDILKEMTSYLKTRYNIITLSVKRLIDTHKDFEDLLLLISLLDSQNILKDILTSYKNEITVDNFIYNLRKYSLVICKPSDDFYATPYLTIHRSTQEICLSYLTHKLKLNKNNKRLKFISNTLENFISNVIDDVDFSIIKNLKCHCEQFLSHSNLLTTDIKKSISGILGRIHSFLGNYLEAKALLETSLVNLNKKENENNFQLALVKGYLGCVYTQLGDHEKAKEFLKKSYAIYNQSLPEEHIRRAWILVNLGVVERKLGNFYNAKDLVKEGLMLYKTYSPEDSKICWCLAHLGVIEKELSNPIEAKFFLEKSLHIFNGDDSINNIKKAWFLFHLANIYRITGNYKKAKELITQSLSLYKEYFPKDHIKIAKANVELGNIYRMLGKHNRAKSLLESSLLMCETHFGTHHIETAHILESLGQLYFSEDNLEAAESSIRKALQIFQYKKHPKSYKSLENLAEVYLKKSIEEVNKGDNEQSHVFKTQAVSFLNQALEVVKNHFSRDTPHKTRIQHTLERLSAKTTK